MDPISATASLVAVIGLGTSVAQGLYTLASRMGKAGEEVHLYSNEIASLTSCFKHIRKIIAESPVRGNANLDLITNLEEISQRIMQPFDALQKTLNRCLTRIQSRKSPAKVRSLLNKLKWVFKMKEEVLFYRDAIAVQHQGLQTILLLLHTSRIPGKNALESNETTEAQLEVAIEELRISIQPRDNTLSIDDNARSSMRTLTDGNSATRSSLKIAPVEDNDDDTETIYSDTVTRTSSNVSRGSLIPSQQYQADTATTSDEEDFEDISNPDLSGLTPAELADLDRQIQKAVDPFQDFATAKAEIIEDTRALSRRAIRRAESVLNSLWDAENNKQDEDLVSRQSNIAANLAMATPDISTEPPALLAVATLATDKLRPVLFPKDQVRTYEDFLTRCRSNTWSGGGLPPENAHYLRVGNHYVALESGLVIIPEVWPYFVMQSAFTKVYLILKQDLERIAGETDDKGNRMEKPLLTFIARKVPDPIGKPL